jgi:hypothetical protein
MRSGISPDFRRHNEEARARSRAFFVGAVHVDEPQMNMNMNGGMVGTAKIGLLRACVTFPRRCKELVCRFPCVFWKIRKFQHSLCDTSAALGLGSHSEKSDVGDREGRAGRRTAELRFVDRFGGRDFHRAMAEGRQCCNRS